MADIDALVTANVDNTGDNRNLPEKYGMALLLVKSQHYWQAVENLKTEADQIGMKTPEFDWAKHVCEKYDREMQAKNNGGASPPSKNQRTRAIRLDFNVKL